MVFVTSNSKGSSPFLNPPPITTLSETVPGLSFTYHYSKRWGSMFHIPLRPRLRPARSGLSPPGTPSSLRGFLAPLLPQLRPPPRRIRTLSPSALASAYPPLSRSPCSPASPPPADILRPVMRNCSPGGQRLAHRQRAGDGGLAGGVARRLDRRLKQSESMGQSSR